MMYDHFEDRDVLAAIGALTVSSKSTNVQGVKLFDAGYIVGAQYHGDLDDNIDRLIKREWLVPDTTLNLDGEPLGEFETPPVVRMTELGWYELWRR